MPSSQDSEPGSAERQQPSLEWPVGLARRSIEMTVMNYCGFTTVVVVTGFAFYRYFTGDTAGALINAVIVVMLTSILLLGQVARFRQTALVLFGIVISLSCLLSAMLVSSNGLLWTYLVLWINFLVLPRNLAIACNLVITVALSASVYLFDSLLHQISWLTVAVLISGFGLVFTNQLREQRRLLSELATLDPLTGAGNRRLMQHELEKAVAERRRSRRPATLMVLDLDHFKRINDTHGHEAGDKVLSQFVEVLRDELRTEDGLYRLGGEEFVVLLRDMDAGTAKSNLDDLHRRLSGKIEGPDAPLHFSAGAAVINDGENWSKWLARADHALYEAKRAGRDRLVIA
ncbi:GGDEF domain-containing protein [Wenzhouxiangella sp. EGI_FJ10305]|uniref:GGDEF domain-containing protein n=1 Tax=Wenzhouxiangella sp. EGI_FJ10305 TaxID=3243768 RepID=UPI0035DEF775